MEYTRIGHTDIEVSRICLGCMSFGKAGTMHDWTLDEKASEEVIKYALDRGINFLIPQMDIQPVQVRSTWERR